MTYQHFEPPVATITLEADTYPKVMASQMLIAGWHANYTGVMHMLSSLSIYRECVYSQPLNATVEMIMHFTQSHPAVMRHKDETVYESKMRRSQELTTQLLDYIKFFDVEPLEECVGISDDTATS